MIFMCIPRLNLCPICCGFEWDACSVGYAMVSVFAASCLVMCLVRVLSKNCTPGLLCEASVIQSIHFRISPLTKPRQHNRRPSWCHRRSGLGQAQHINRNIDSQNQILTFLPSECGMHKTKHIFSAQNTCYVCYSSIIMTHVTLLLVNKWV